MPTLKNILVVDDDPAIHELLHAVLESPEWHVETAHDGLEGLARLKAKAYDLVLTDVRMPGMDGLELLKRIRRERPGTKVIVMTAQSTPENIIRSLRDQAFSYFSKPFSPNAVADIVTQAIESQKCEDDIRVLSALPAWIALEVRCRLEVTDRLVQFMSELKMDLPASDREDIAMAFREILRNAIEHGGRFDPTQMVDVACIRAERAIIYYIRDPGRGFSFNDLPHAAISYSEGPPIKHMDYRLEHGIRPGGFGILLVRKLVDELIYNEQGNEVVMVKYLPARDQRKDGQGHS